jgi:hypothetical protein
MWCTDFSIADLIKVLIEWLTPDGDPNSPNPAHYVS